MAIERGTTTQTFQFIHLVRGVTVRVKNVVNAMVQRPLFANHFLFTFCRKIKSYQIGADEIPSDFRRYGTPKLFQASQFVSLSQNQVTQLISTLASVSYLQLGWRATISWKLFSPSWSFCLCGFFSFSFLGLNVLIYISLSFTSNHIACSLMYY